MDNSDRFKKTYITECYDLLAEMEESLLNLDIEASDNEALNAIFRCAHSIKGGSGAFGFDYITNFTHELEALLDSMREGRVKPSREIVDTLLKATDIVSLMVHSAEDGVRPSEGLGDDIKERLLQFASGDLASTDSEQSAYGLYPMEQQPDSSQEQRMWQINFIPAPSLFCTGNEPLFILRELEWLGEARVSVNTEKVPDLLQLDPGQCYLEWTIELNTVQPEKTIREVFDFVSDHCVLHLKQRDLVSEGVVNMPASTAASTVAAKNTETRSSQNSSIRVDLEKIDRLVNIVGELVITEAMIKAQSNDLPLEQHIGLMRGIDELSQHTRELQEAVMGVRMLPVKTIFSRMPRIVHDLAEQLGKHIKLVTFGENTEVDKTVLDQISDPLMHMIRNSCDHGIESPEVRKSNGKPAEGTIHLSAKHRGGRIVIEIADDGAGIDRERVLRKAQEKNLLPMDAKLSDEQVDQLIFMAGLSTAEKLSNVSGRGVGMDVVKRNIEGMGGEVYVSNNPGTGLLFTISLPLTLAILDGMIVRAGNEYYIVPIADIIATLRPKAELIRHLEGHNDVIDVRGEFISMIYLHHIFDIKGAQKDPSRALVVLLESNRQKIGLVVDELIGQQQVVIKNLEANAGSVEGISGATILGDGRVALILEINQLAKMHPESPIDLSLEQTI